MSLELITGSMFSGKTLELIRRLRAAHGRGERVRAGKPSLAIDRGWLVSLAGSRWPAEPLDGTETIRRAARESTVLGVDEVQFLTPGEITCLVDLAAEGVHVVAAGLDLDFRARPFRGVETLSAAASHVTRLTTICVRCGGIATRSQRIIAGRRVAARQPAVSPGGRELYEPRCAGCHEVPEAAASASAPPRRRRV